MKLNCKKKCVEENGTWDILKETIQKDIILVAVSFFLSYRDVSEILKRTGRFRSPNNNHAIYKQKRSHIQTSLFQRCKELQKLFRTA
jgi:hypothetical protein